MKCSRRLFTLGVLAAAFAAAGGVHAQSALDDVLKAKEIKIAIPTDFPPYGFVGTDLKPQGLDIDMANYIGAKLGVKVDLLPVTTANRIADVLGEHEIGIGPRLRTRGSETVMTDGGNLIYDATCGAIANPAALAADLKSITGVVVHGLFLDLTDEALIATATGVERLVP